MNSSAPSPFLPGTNVQYAWDSTSIATAQECPRRYQYLILEGWQPKGGSSAIALDFGILVHSGIEEYHRCRAQGFTHTEACEEAVAWILRLPEFARLPTEDQFQDAKASAEEDEEDDGVTTRNARVRTRYHLLRALVWYFEHYKHDPLEVVTLSNGLPAVELSFRAPVGFALSNGTEVILSGHLDKLVQFNEQLFVSDIKTTKSITHSWRRSFDLSHQMSGYTLGGNIALERPVSGVVIDGIALQVGGVKFARHFTYRTSSQLGEYLHNLKLLTEAFERYAAENYYPMNTSFCMFCSYKEVCQQPPEMRAGYLNHLFRKGETWNPLKNRG